MARSDTYGMARIRPFWYLTLMSPASHRQCCLASFSVSVLTALRLSAHCAIIRDARRMSEGVYGLSLSFVFCDTQTVPRQKYIRRLVLG